MPKLTDSLNLVLTRLIKFRDERNWLQFHTPRNLATALMMESAEVLEHFQWKLNDKLSNEEIKSLTEEIADVFIYNIQLANVLGIDLLDAVNEKIDKNAQKYPVTKSNNNAAKYTKL